MKNVYSRYQLILLKRLYCSCSFALRRKTAVATYEFYILYYVAKICYYMNGVGRLYN